MPFHRIEESEMRYFENKVQRYNYFGKTQNYAMISF